MGRKSDVPRLEARSTSGSRTRVLVWSWFPSEKVNFPSYPQRVHRIEYTAAIFALLRSLNLCSSGSESSTSRPQPSRSSHSANQPHPHLPHILHFGRLPPSLRSVDTRPIRRGWADAIFWEREFRVVFAFRVYRLTVNQWYY